MSYFDSRFRGPSLDPPDDYRPYCEVCGRSVDADECICPECPECGASGDPKCYEDHGLIRTQEQINRRRETDEYLDRLNQYEGEPQMDWESAEDN